LLTAGQLSTNLRQGHQGRRLIHFAAMHDAATDQMHWAYRVFRAACRVLLRSYYPDLVVEGGASVPAGPLIVAANHPNSLVDPVLISVFLPRKIHWLAKATLFERPVGRSLLRGLGAIPVKRRHEGGDRSSTEALLRSAADALLEGKALGIFPEGRSHDQERWGSLKTGIGRIAVLAARDLAASGSTERVRVLPVALCFASKTRFRSGALVLVGRPFEVLPQDSAEAVTEAVERELAEALIHVEDARQEQLLQAARVLIRRRARLEPGHADPRDIHRVDRDIARAIRRFSKDEPERIEAFSQRLRAYLDHLDWQGFSLHALEPQREAPGRLVLATALLPLALWGALHSWIPYQLTTWAGHRLERATDRTTVATFRLLTGAFLFPAAWIIETLFAQRSWGTGAALLFAATVVPTALIARFTFHVLRRKVGHAVDAVLMAANPHAVERLRTERAFLWSEIERWRAMLDAPLGRPAGPTVSPRGSS
jgi:1-acyl-sn-glycerol-3-phosphate acyltransferase